MDGFNPPSWAPDDKNLTTPGAEAAEYEHGRSTAVDGQQQQSAISFNNPNQPRFAMGNMGDHRQTGDTAPDNFQFALSQGLTLPLVNPLQYSDYDPGFEIFGTDMQDGFDNDADGHGSPTLATSTPIHDNIPFKTNPAQLAFPNEGGGSFPLDSGMAQNQLIISRPSPLMPSTHNGKLRTQALLGSTGGSGGFNHFSGTAPEHHVASNNQGQTAASNFVQMTVQDNGSPLGWPNRKLTSQPLSNNMQYASQSGMGQDLGNKPSFDNPKAGRRTNVPSWVVEFEHNTNGVEENHHSNQRGTKRKRECAEGLQVSWNGLSENSSHGSTLSTQDTDEDPHSRDLLDESSTPMRFQDRPLKLQEILYKCMFPAGRAAFIDFALSPNCLKAHERRTGLPITMAICKASRKFTKQHYTIVKRHGEGIRGVITKSFCFNPEVDALCISYSFREPWQHSNDMYDYWYDKVDRKLKKRGALKDVGLKGVRFLDVRDVVTGYPVDTSDISWFLPRLYKNSFLSRFESLERLVFTSALNNEPEIYEDEPGGVVLDSLEECEIFWEELAEYLEKQKDSYKGKLMAKERVIVREYEVPQDRRALEGLEMMNSLF